MCKEKNQLAHHGFLLIINNVSQASKKIIFLNLNYKLLIKDTFQIFSIIKKLYLALFCKFVIAYAFLIK